MPEKLRVTEKMKIETSFVLNYLDINKLHYSIYN